MAQTANFTQAYHVFRLLANGLKPPARSRTAEQRQRRPRSCIGRRAEQVAAAFLTPTDTCEGVAWCEACLPPREE
eukprot:15433765-Alexandrium_andersonii.AAC.1